MVKLSLDGGLHLPEPRRHQRPVGGCRILLRERLRRHWPAGSGDIRSRPGQPDTVAIVRTNGPDAGYIAYFQSHTNTYAPVDGASRKSSRAALAAPGCHRASPSPHGRTVCRLTWSICSDELNRADILVGGTRAFRPYMLRLPQP